MELLMIRHSSTRGNLLRQYVGSQDHPLAPEGVALAERRRGEMPPIDGLWVSPMLRCRQTAEILFPGVEQRLVDALKVLKDVNGIAQCYFTDKDVVRHRLVQEIVKAYERAAHPAADAKNKENNKNFK